MTKQSNIGKRVQVTKTKKILNEETNVIEEKVYKMEGVIIGIDKTGRKNVYIVEYGEGLAGTEEPENLTFIETSEEDEHAR